MMKKVVYMPENTTKKTEHEARFLGCSQVFSRGALREDLIVILIAIILIRSPSGLLSIEC